MLVDCVRETGASISATHQRCFDGRCSYFRDTLTRSSRRVSISRESRIRSIKRAADQRMASDSSRPIFLPRSPQKPHLSTHTASDYLIVDVAGDSVDRSARSERGKVSFETRRDVGSLYRDGTGLRESAQIAKRTPAVLRFGRFLGARSNYDSESDGETIGEPPPRGTTGHC